MQFDSIGFDLDGTLWDFTPSAAKAWEKVLRAQPDRPLWPSLETIRRYAGLPFDEFASEMIPNIKNAARLKELCGLCDAAEHEMILQEGGVLYPGIEQLLQTLSGRYRLFIASNCHSDYLKNFLAYYGFEKYFAATTCYGDTRLQKGEAIAQLKKQNGFVQTLFVGDTEGDLQAAAQAGCVFVHAQYGFGQVNTKYSIENPQALLGVLQSV